MKIDLAVDLDSFADVFEAAASVNAWLAVVSAFLAFGLFMAVRHELRCSSPVDPAHRRGF